MGGGVEAEGAAYTWGKECAPCPPRKGSLLWLGPRFARGPGVGAGARAAGPRTHSPRGLAATAQSDPPGVQEYSAERRPSPEGSSAAPPPGPPCCCPHRRPRRCPRRPRVGMSASAPWERPAASLGAPASCLPGALRSASTLGVHPRGPACGPSALDRRAGCHGLQSWPLWAAPVTPTWASPAEANRQLRAAFLDGCRAGLGQASPSGIQPFSFP